MSILDVRSLIERFATHKQPRLRGRLLSLEAVSAAVFILLIWTPLLARVLSLGAPDPKLESRRLEPMPQPRLPWQPKRDIPINEWKYFPAEFERHFADYFPYRQVVACRMNSVLCDIGHSPEPMVYPGKDNWLFYRGERSLEQFRRTPIATELQQEWDEFVQGLDHWVSRTGAHMVFVVCPNKETIYPEYMPDRYPVVDQRPHVTDQFINRLTGSGIDVLDLRSPLIDAKRDGPVFYRLDTHWNSRGRFVAYQAITSHLGKRHSTIKPYPASRVRRVSAAVPYHDLATMLLLPDRETEVEYQPLDLFRGQRTVSQNPSDPRTTTQYEVNDPTLPSAVVIHDSFFLFLDSWLKDHFSQSSWTIWKPDPRPEWFSGFSPEVVIYQIVERKLMLPPPTLSHLHQFEYQQCPKVMVVDSPPNQGRFRPKSGATFTDRCPKPPRLHGTFSVLLPDQLPAGRRTVMRWDIESQGSGKLVVSYQVAGSDQVHRATRRFLGSRCSQYLALPPDVDWPSLTTELHSEHPSGVTVHAFELRSE